MGFFEYFDRTYIVNLPDRKDRRTETEDMLSKMGQGIRPGVIEFFPGIRPESAAGFPTLGSRGSYLSKLGVMKKAREEGLESFLMIEDDLEISPDVVKNADAYLEVLKREPWGLVYFGHGLDPDDSPGEVLRAYAELIPLCHFMAIHRRALDPLITYLDLVLTRPPGHKDGGLMYFDGAMSMFRARHPDLLTLAARPSMGWQRSSRSDVTPRWHDRQPVLRDLVALARKLKKLGQKRPQNRVTASLSRQGS